MESGLLLTKFPFTLHFQRYTNMQIRTISLAETMPVRSIALRNGQTYNKCTVPEDSNFDVFHIGAVIDGKVVGTASFFRKDLPEYENTGFQLRMMGILPEYRGIGAGKAIVEYALELLKAEYRVAYLWCHAREVAYGFYANLGFEFISGEFQIPVIGTHRSMLLRL